MYTQLVIYSINNRDTVLMLCCYRIFAPHFDNEPRNICKRFNKTVEKYDYYSNNKLLINKTTKSRLVDLFFV